MSKISVKENADRKSCTCCGHGDFVTVPRLRAAATVEYVLAPKQPVIHADNMAVFIAQSLL